MICPSYQHSLPCLYLRYNSAVLKMVAASQIALFALSLVGHLIHTALCNVLVEILNVLNMHILPNWMFHKCEQNDAHDTGNISIRWHVEARCDVLGLNISLSVNITYGIGTRCFVLGLPPTIIFIIDYSSSYLTYYLFCLHYKMSGDSDV